MVLVVMPTPGRGSRLLSHFSPPAGNGDAEPAGTAEHPYPMAALRLGGMGSSLCPPETCSNAWHPTVPDKVSLCGMTSPPALSVPAAQCRLPKCHPGERSPPSAQAQTPSCRFIFRWDLRHTHLHTTGTLQHTQRRGSTLTPRRPRVCCADTESHPVPTKHGINK